MSSIKLSVLCTHWNTYFNVCAVLDKEDNRVIILLYTAAGLARRAITLTAVFYIGSLCELVFSRWLRQTSGVAFKENRGYVLGFIYPAEAAKYTNDHRLALKFMGLLECRHHRETNPCQLLADKENSLREAARKLCLASVERLGWGGRL